MEYTDTGQPPGMTSISQNISCTTYTGDMGYPHGQTMHPTEMGYQPGRHTFLQDINQISSVKWDTNLSGHPVI